MSAVRTPEEIVARIEHLQGNPFDDFFGVQRSDLIRTLPYEHARPYLGPEETAETWIPAPDPLASALAYVPFAVGKIVDHRGLSAGLSVDHFEGWAWLLGDDILAAFEAADYPQYGAPKVYAFLRAVDRLDAWPAADHPELERMRVGDRCTPDCWEGCAS